MNKQQYQQAHHLIRLLRYEQNLLDIFHYPIGFDCPCRGNYDCEFCNDEMKGRETAGKALKQVQTEIAEILPEVDRSQLPLVCSTLWIKCLHETSLDWLGGWLQVCSTYKQVGNLWAYDRAKQTIFHYWESVRNHEYLREQRTIRLSELEYALEHTGCRVS